MTYNKARDWEARLKRWRVHRARAVREVDQDGKPEAWLVVELESGARIYARTERFLLEFLRKHGLYR